MEKLTNKEEEIMQIIWDLDECFVKDVIDKLPDPKPPYTTISSIVRILENKGFVDHKAYGNTHQYFPIVSKEAYGKQTFKNVVNKYFDNSFKSVVSFLIKEEKLSKDEIVELMDLIHNDDKE